MREIFLGEVGLSPLIDHEFVVVLGDETFDFSLPAGVQLEQEEEFLEHAGVEGSQFVGLEGGVEFADRVLPELVVQVYVPAQIVHKNIDITGPASDPVVPTTSCGAVVRAGAGAQAKSLSVHVWRGLAPPLSVATGQVWLPFPRNRRCFSVFRVEYWRWPVCVPYEDE